MRLYTHTHTHTGSFRENRLRKGKKENGITLIALIITIIVLLILAGVTIAAVLGDNGIINQAQEAKNTMEQAQKDEMEQIENLANSMNEILGNSENNNTVIPPEPPQDTTPPTITVNKGTVDTSSIQVNVTSKDDQSGMPANPTYSYYIKKSTENSYQSSPTHTGIQNSWTFTGLTQNTSYDVKVTTQDNAGNLGTGTLTGIKTTTVGGAGDSSGNIGTDTGNITAGPVSWNPSTHKASVTLSTSTNLSIQYKVGASTSWTPTTGTSATEGKPITVSGLNHNDIVYARLIDTAGNYGDEAHLTILDGINPTVTVNKGTTTTSTITVSVTSKDDQSGMPTNPTYSYYIKKLSENSYQSSPAHTGAETSYTFTGLTQNTSYDVKVTTKDNANNTGTGTLTNISTTTVEGTTPGLGTGSITAGTATWNKSTHKASVVLSTSTDKTIQYKIGAGGIYTPTSGSSAIAGQSVTVTNLNHNDIVYARLVDEAGNYGSEAFITILDGIKPIIPNINVSATNIKAGETLTTTVTHTDDQSGVNVANSKYIWNTTPGTIGTTNASWNTASSFASNPQTITLNTSNAGTYYLHVLTTDNGGNKVESVLSAVTIKAQTFTSDEVANSSNKKDFYGKIVTNYTCKNSSAVANWKIYYAGSDFSADGKNHIYLIADDYVARNYLPNSSEGHALNASSSYPKAAYFTNILNDYTGSASITDAGIKKLNNSYFSQNFTSTRENMKSVAYMCDTNAWSGYKGTKADYAVGGPSVEMLMKSYSQKYGVDYRAKATSATGYKVSKDGGASWSTNCIDMLTTDDQMYVITSTSNAGACWLASPTENNHYDLMRIRSGGHVDSNNYNNSAQGFRPLVCLSSDVVLEKTPDGNYKIVIEPGSADDFANRLDKNNIYGKTVTGYTCPNSSAVTNWKIFYAGNDFSTDGKNRIYLIADDYVEYRYLPKASNGSALNQGNTNYQAYFTNILGSYSGSSSITDLRMKKLNNSYFSQNFSSSNPNMKAVAYMCDTNAWSVYKGAKAEYAVGGPSVEMLMKSYSQKCNVDYRAQAVGERGYRVSKDGGVNWESNYSGMLSTRESLYINDTGTNKASGYWIASPSGGNGVCPMEVRNDGTVSLSNYYDGNGFRPLVCLSSDVRLQDLGNGIFAIK